MNKKYNFIVFLIFILFIIPNIYSEINITILEKPTLTLELVEGGSLTENTRYYFSGYFQCGVSAAYAGDSVSPAADQVYIDTNTTHKSIKITWGTITPPVTKIAIRWDTIPLIDENGEFITYRATSNLKYLNHIYTGFTGTNTTMSSHTYAGVAGAWSHPELSVPFDHIDPKINRKKGICRIEVTATHTYDEFITAIRNSDANDLVIINRDDIILPCAIYGSGKIEFNKKNITFLYSTSFNKNLEFNNSQIHFVSPRQWIGLDFKINNSSVIITEPTTTNFEFLVGFSGKNNKIHFLNNAFNSLTYGSISNVEITNNRINFRYPQNNWYLNNSIINNGYISHTPIISYNNANIYYVNTIWNNQNTSQVYDLLLADEGYYVNKDDDFYQNIYLINSKSDRSDKLPIVSFGNYDNSSNLIDIKVFVSHTLSFKILDQNGDPLENATISITDNNNTNYTLTTNSLGEIDQNIQTHLIKYRSQSQGGGANRSEIIDLNPFTIVVNKDGYSTYTTTQTIQEKEEFIINLPESSLKIGSVANSFKGVIDEIRILNKTKDPSTIKTEHNNQVNPSEFYSIGSKETAPTASLLAWVKVPRIYDNRDTPIYIYFGNPSANEINDKDVWDEDYVLVNHLNEDSIDSTIYSNTGTNSNVAYFTDKFFKTNSAYLFNGSNSKISSNYLDLDLYKGTFCFWIYRIGNNKWQGIIAKMIDTAGYKIALNTTNRINLMLRNGAGDYVIWLDSTNSVPSQIWTHVCVSFNDTNQSLANIYINGLLNKTGMLSNNTTVASNHVFNVGDSSSTGLGAGKLDGALDYLRISKIVRSAPWIKTEYTNQANPEEFIKVGILEKA